MSEIEYRAWVKKERYHHITGEIMRGFMTNSNLIIRFGCWIEHFGSCDHPFSESQGGAPTHREWKDVVLMQYTGLKDKNGVKIFEGDIVKRVSEFQGKIKHEKSFIIIYGNMDNCGCCSDDSGIGFNFHGHDPSSLEVIGNIYQHPELLEKI